MGYTGLHAIEGDATTHTAGGRAVSRPPAPELFVREHVTAPENRLNLALFAMLNVDAFRVWFLSRLALPDDSVVFPPQNVAGGRPDFVIVKPGESVLGWIEVELGLPDGPQLDRYRSTLGGRVICIAGSGGDALGPDYLELREIAEQVRPMRPMLIAQQQRSAEVLLRLIDLLAGKTQSWDYVDPDDRVKRQPLVAALAERLPDQIISGTPPLPQGKILLSTTTQKGWTLRVYSHASRTNRSFSVMWNPAIGRGVVRVPSQARLSRYLPKGSAATDYVSWLAETFAVDVSGLSEAQHLPVSELALLERADDLAGALNALSSAG